MQTQRASEAEVSDSFSMQSVAPSTPVASAIETEAAENVWAEWPYCWAINLYDLARERFHSFHEKHTEWKLARFNRAAQQKFQSEFWRSWQREGEEEVLELRLV